ncbi:MAG: phosphoenolpyruvate--protein phosphotransferase [bacterium]|nr:phosphoenolpyruvate--protein phosphotransferase [bacterium]
MITLTGIAASHGIAFGKAFLYEVEKFKVIRRQISDQNVEAEIEQFKQAVAKAKREIIQIRDNVAQRMSKEYADIFSAHLLLLEDHFLILEVTKKIKEEYKNVEFALWEVLEMLTKNFYELEDEYIRERAVDIYDIGKKILYNMVERKRVGLEGIEPGTVIVAHNLTPSDTVQIDKEKVVAFVTDVGGPTSHTAILARAMEIPAVVGLNNVTSQVKDGDSLIVDGLSGQIVINPTQTVLEEYNRRSVEFEAFQAGLAKLKDLPAETPDRYRLEIGANIELIEEVTSAKEHGAEGIGLYRTEFFYLNRDDLPSEEEMFKTYREAVEATFPYPVIFRTLDLGGDKLPYHLEEPWNQIESNPFLGLRAIRLCLQHPDILKTQFRAILRASKHGKVKIIIPMISSVEEVRETKAILADVMQELKDKEIPFDEKIEFGIMIETPSAAVTADILAKEVDFFSIGTNDLIQYALAVDRGNEHIAYLYRPSHPAILRLLKKTIEAAHREGKWVGMCGEMASNPLFTVLLLGLGLDEFSMSGVSIPEIKEIIRATTLQEARELLQQALTLSGTDEVEGLMRERLSARFGHLMERA